MLFDLSILALPIIETRKFHSVTFSPGNSERELGLNRCETGELRGISWKPVF